MVELFLVWNVILINQNCINCERSGGDGGGEGEWLYCAGPTCDI